MPKIKEYNSLCVKSKFENIDIYTFVIKIKDLLEIHYIARRGVHEEEGAVQRVLNKSRINSIKDFVLGGKSFLNTFIINWTNENDLPKFKKDLVTLPIIKKSAQVIDGQHRLVGLQEAFNTDKKIGQKEVIVSMCIRLSTKQAASIFLNINSEQKPVPRSLVYDLFGEVYDDKELAINRAGDIASELHKNKKSPFYDKIKYVGKSGLIDLASVVGSLKNHLDSKGVFAKHGITRLEYQKKIILNYFIAIAEEYIDQNIWHTNTKNPFITSAGFYGAIEALATTFLPKCIESGHFTVTEFAKLLGLNSQKLLLKEDLKAIEGKTRRKAIQGYLESNLHNLVPNQHNFVY